MTMPSTSGAGAGPGAGEGAREQIREVKDRAVDQAKSTFRQARDWATSGLSEGRIRTAEQVGNLATAVHRTSQHLRDEDQARIAGLADSFARQVERAAFYLRDADARTMARDLEGLARRRPVMVIGAALALGLVGARFFKSSDPRGGSE